MLLFRWCCGTNDSNGEDGDVIAVLLLIMAVEILVVGDCGDAGKCDSENNVVMLIRL